MAALPKTWRRTAKVAIAAAAAYALYRMLFAEDEEDEDEACDHYGCHGLQPATSSSPEKRPSFSVTDEQGCDRGALGDDRAHKWGWLVDSAPLAPAAKPSAQPALRGRHRRRASSSGSAVYDADSSEFGGEEGSTSADELAEPSSERKSVRFRLDEERGFCEAAGLELARFAWSALDGLAADSPPCSL